MSIVTNEYQARSGIKYFLKAFDNSRLYHPDEVKEIKSSNQDYYNAIKADEKLAKYEEEQAKIVKPLSSDERWLLQVAAQKERDDARQAYADREALKVKEHLDYLASTPEIAQVCSTNFYVFQQEMFNWMSKNYTIVVSTLEANPPSLFACQLAPAVKSKKK